jgi:hypothetical protein
MPKYTSTVKEIQKLNQRIITNEEDLRTKQKTVDKLNEQLHRVHTKYVSLSEHSINISRQNAILRKRTQTDNIHKTDTDKKTKFLFDEKIFNNDKEIKTSSSSTLKLNKHTTLHSIHTQTTQLPSRVHQSTETIIIKTKNRKIQISPIMTEQSTTTTQIPFVHPQTPPAYEPTSDED